MGIFHVCVNMVRPDCNYLSSEALGKVQQALLQVCISHSIPVRLSMRSTHIVVKLVCAG